MIILSNLDSVSSTMALFLKLAIVLFISGFFANKNARGSPLDDSIMTVAVVEYKPVERGEMTNEELLLENIRQYLLTVTALGDPSIAIDMIVFPEATLNSGANYSNILEFATYTYTDMNACENKNWIFPQYIKILACAAKTYNTYIVINTIEKSVCKKNSTTENCQRTGHNLYNSDVVIDNGGNIVSRYRKINLFGEYPLNSPNNRELVTFTVKDKGVTFGIFTCFDMLFKNPAEDLVAQGVKNFVFPTMWFSELPFLTALQTQQMWAQTNEVSLFSAGANNPKVGSGGTGIFNGSSGPFTDDIIAAGGSKAYVYRFSTKGLPVDQLAEPVNPNPTLTEIDEMAKSMEGFYLKTDDGLPDYTSAVLNLTSATDKLHTQEVCHESNSTKFCCTFSIKISWNGETISNSYVYHLLAFSGIRSFSGVYDGGVDICGVTACLNASKSSCGKRRDNVDYDSIGWPVTFQEIEIKANFSKDSNRTQYPNSLLASIRPINPQNTNWTYRNVVSETGQKLIERTFKLLKPTNRLFTFAIYGRNFDVDAPNVGNDYEDDSKTGDDDAAATPHGLGLFLCSLMLILTFSL